MKKKILIKGIKFRRKRDIKKEIYIPLINSIGSYSPTYVNNNIILYKIITIKGFSIKSKDMDNIINKLRTKIKTIFNIYKKKEVMNKFITLKYLNIPKSLFIKEDLTSKGILIRQGKGKGKYRDTVYLIDNNTLFFSFIISIPNNITNFNLFYSINNSLNSSLSSFPVPLTSFISLNN